MRPEPELDSNRALITKFCERLSERDYEGLAALVAPEATWWVVGRPDKVSYGGTHRITDFLKMLEAFLGTMDHFKFDIVSITAQANRVAVEAVAEGGTSKSPFSNDYMMMFIVDAGSIRSVREFIDPVAAEVYLENLNA